MRVYLDNNEVWGISDLDSANYQTYTKVSVDVSSYADGNQHNLKFWGQIQGTPAITNFILDDIAIEVVFHTGIVQNLLSEGISIYPNPSNSQFNVDLNLHDKTDMQVDLYSLSGALVYQKSLSDVQHGTLKIDVSDLASGNYIIKMITPEKVITENISIVH